MNKVVSIHIFYSPVRFSGSDAETFVSLKKKQKVHLSGNQDIHWTPTADQLMTACCCRRRHSQHKQQ